ncbi:MAG: hypothetical protein ACI9TY_000780 [Alphaproteobacteria bacterium]|jgi:hypothetical protein
MTISKALTSTETAVLNKLSNQPIKHSLDASVGNKECETADALEKRGLCTCTSSPSVGVVYTITEKGIRVVKALSAII